MWLAGSETGTAKGLTSFDIFACCLWILALRKVCDDFWTESGPLEQRHAVS